MLEKIISIGAEATLTQTKLLGKSILRKERAKKSYRHPSLDEKLRRERTRHEAKVLHHAKIIGIPTPIVYSIDEKNATLYLEYIPAPRLKNVLQKNPKKKEKYCIELGKIIATLHKNGIVHGDLTTSNVLLRKKRKKEELVLIDFGLAFYSTKLEDLAVDLLNLKKTFMATHSYFEKGWECIQQGYTKNEGKEAVLKRILEVEKRIRYA